MDFSDSLRRRDVVQPFQQKIPISTKPNFPLCVFWFGIFLFYTLHLCVFLRVRIFPLIFEVQPNISYQTFYTILRKLIFYPKMIAPVYCGSRTFRQYGYWEVIQGSLVWILRNYFKLRVVEV